MLETLKNQFQNKEVKLLDLDNLVLKTLEDKEMEFKLESIFDYDVEDMLRDNFAYGDYNFEFEIIEDSEYPLEIVVKVIDIVNIA